jgi:hypothetical protein
MVAEEAEMYINGPMMHMNRRMLLLNWQSLVVPLAAQSPYFFLSLAVEE